ncbi:hypothetical protein QKW35_05370 [Pontibacterium granulatum]|uniref:hypothetical protein n=1 Tax=Pontibacterium granulatum TaxID=2036029 RepID=UPI00249BACE7|nr:hypothetical protein [Pontibacterium granulatum]MDI3323801.1 hypothetical protein [Pontibacterium granulatum]
MKLEKTFVSVVVLALCFVVGGCAGYGNAPWPTQGDAVNEMVEQQTAFPEKVVEAGNPPLDGTIAERVVKTYRADTANRDAVRNTIEVNIGQ